MDESYLSTEFKTADSAHTGRRDQAFSPILEGWGLGTRPQSLHISLAVFALVAS